MKNRDKSLVSFGLLGIGFAAAFLSCAPTSRFDTGDRAAAPAQKRSLLVEVDRLEPAQPLPATVKQNGVDIT